MLKNDILAYGPWTTSKLNVNFENKIVENDETTKIHINNMWKEYCNRRKKSYDNELLRLNSWHTENDSMNLNIGVTFYSHYIGTRDPLFLNKCVTGKRADPIGLTIIPITIDKKIIITKRSSKMEQNPNKLYFCGGYAEPKLDKNCKINLENEILREAFEELGVDKHLFFNFIGLAYDPVYCHPELFSIVILNVTKKEILETWSKAKDRDESEYLLFISLDDARKDKHKKFPPEETSWSYQIGVELFTDRVLNNILEYFNKNKI